MANEITINLVVQILNGTFRDSIQPGQTQIDQSAIGRAGHVQEIGTSPEVVDLGDVSTNGILFLQNHDDTNYITYGPQSDGASIEVMNKLKPGEWAIMRLAPSVVLWAQADTDDCLLDVKLYED